MATLAVASILLGLLLVLLVCGVWIAIALAAVAWAGLQFFTSSPPAVNLFQSFWGSSANWTIAALPLFIWMGEILFRTKLSEEMFEGLAPWLNWLPGRLMHVNVLACGNFGHSECDVRDAWRRRLFGTMMSMSPSFRAKARSAQSRNRRRRAPHDSL